MFNKQQYRVKGMTRIGQEREQKVSRFSQICCDFLKRYKERRTIQFSVFLTVHVYLITYVNENYTFKSPCHDSDPLK